MVQLVVGVEEDVANELYGCFPAQLAFADVFADYLHTRVSRSARKSYAKGGNIRSPGLHESAQ